MPLSLLSLMLVVFSLTTGEFVIAGILPEVADDLSVSIPAAGLLVTAYAAGMIIGGPVVTTLTAGRARKPLIVGLVAVSVAANLCSAAAPGYPLLLASRFVAGLVVATFFAVAITVAVGTAPADRAAGAVARLTLGMNLGMVLGTPLGTVIGQHLGWRATFLAIALVSAGALLLVVPTVPAPPTTATGSALGELRALVSGDVWLAITLTAVGNAGAVMVFTYVAPLLTDVSGFSAGAVPVLLLAYGAGAVLGNLLGGRLADRAGLPALVGMLVALSCGLALFWAVAELAVAAAVLIFLLGTLAYAVIPGMQARVMATASAAPTLAVAVNASGYQLAAASAGWLGGRLIDDGPGLRSLPLVGALLTLAGIAVALHALRRERHDRQPTTVTG